MSETNAARTRIETSRKVIAVLQEKYEVKQDTKGRFSCVIEKDGEISPSFCDILRCPAIYFTS